MLTLQAMNYFLRSRCETTKPQRYANLREVLSSFRVSVLFYPQRWVHSLFSRTEVRPVCILSNIIAPAPSFGRFLLEKRRRFRDLVWVVAALILRSPLLYTESIQVAT